MEEKKLSKEQKQMLRRVFNEIDQDRNGRLSNPEIKRASKKIGLRLSSKDIDTMLKEADDNHNGCIEYKEFEKAMEAHILQVEYRNTMFREYFDKFDKNRNGVIERHELKAAFKEMGATLTDDEVQELFDEADPTGKGAINFEEFCECVFE